MLPLDVAAGKKDVFVVVSTSNTVATGRTGLMLQCCCWHGALEDMLLQLLLQCILVFLHPEQADRTDAAAVCTAVERVADVLIVKQLTLLLN